MDSRVARVHARVHRQMGYYSAPRQAEGRLKRLCAKRIEANAGGQTAARSEARSRRLDGA